MSKLPEEFADLERFVDWCLPTEEERYAKRLNSSMAEMQELYDAGMARLEDIMVYVDARFPLAGDAGRRQGPGASGTVDRHGEFPHRGVEATPRARQRRRLHQSDQGAGGLICLL